MCAKSIDLNASVCCELIQFFESQKTQTKASKLSEIESLSGNFNLIDNDSINRDWTFFKEIMWGLR